MSLATMDCALIRTTTRLPIVRTPVSRNQTTTFASTRILHHPKTLLATSRRNNTAAKVFKQGSPSRLASSASTPAISLSPFVADDHPARLVGELTVHQIFDQPTGSWQYIVADPATSKAVIIDPVLEFDPSSGKLSVSPADELLNIVSQRGYLIERILETHAHADHITAASYLQRELSCRQDMRPLICIGSRIRQVQKMFGERYAIPAIDYENVFDHLWEDDEVFNIGELSAQAFHLPGHTPDHMGYRIGGKS